MRHRKSSFERAYEQYAALCARKEEGTAVQYLYVTPWNLLFWPGSCEGYAAAVRNRGWRFDPFILSCGALEHSTGVEQLIQTSVVGKRGIWRRKFAIGLITSAVVSGITFLPLVKIIARLIIRIRRPVSSCVLHLVLPEAFTMGGYLFCVWGFGWPVPAAVMTRNACSVGTIEEPNRCRHAGNIGVLVPVLVCLCLPSSV